MTITLENVSKRVGAHVHIKPTTLTLETGHFNVLLGETGAGKTSLIKLMAGLDTVSGGRISMNGRDITRISPQDRNVSLVHQFFINYPHMTVFENIASPLKVAGLAQSQIKTRVLDVADLLRLTPMLDRRPLELSGGQQQRTALARAIVKQSQAVFLDEPLVNLDYKLREDLRDQLPEILAGRGAVVVYATSEPEEALLLGGQSVLMHDGCVVQAGPTAEVYRNPANLTAARVFSDPPINVARIEKRGGRVHFGAIAAWDLAGKPAHLADGQYTCAIRPDHVLPYRTDKATVALKGTVQISELTGSQSSAHFSIAATNWVSQARGVHPCKVGETRVFFMDPAQCRYFAADGRLIA